MAADFFLGESLVGDGNEIAHIDLIIGSKTGRAGTAFCNALTNNKDGFTTLLAVVAPNLPCKPDTLLFNKVTIKGAKQAVQMFGPAQAAVARAVVDSVADGVIPKDKADDLVRDGRRVHPLGGQRRQEDLRLQLPGHQGSHRARALGKQARRSDEVIAGVEDGQAPVQPEVGIRRAPPVHRPATSHEEPPAPARQLQPPQRVRPGRRLRRRRRSGASSYGLVTPDEVRDLVHGAIFTRGPQELQHTAIFIGGTDMAAGERLLDAVTATFFGPFRVSVMLDANGANTTAVAAVSRIASLGDVRGRRAVVLAGSGPVGSRVAGLLAAAGANVLVTSRRAQNGAIAAQIGQRFTVSVEERVLGSEADAADILRGAEIVVNAGPAGVCLVPRTAWAGQTDLKILVDLNAVPPAGIDGVEPADKAATRAGVVTFGALGVGSLKMKLHRTCITKLFERNDAVLDAEGIAGVARGL